MNGKGNDNGNGRSPWDDNKNGIGNSNRNVKHGNGNRRSPSGMTTRRAGAKAKPGAKSRELSVTEKSFDAVEVFFGVNTDGVECGGLDVDVDAVFEEAELFEALRLFEGAGRQGGEALEGGFAVGVEADVLPVLWCGIVLGVTVVGDWGAGEVEGAAVGCGDYFDGVGIGDVLGGTEDLEGGDFDVRLCEGAEEGGEVFGFEEGFVALDIDVDVGGDLLGD